jgi:hypothetical protein
MRSWIEKIDEIGSLEKENTGNYLPMTNDRLYLCMNDL